MSLYQDRQIKGFLLFLTLFALLFVGTATVLTIYQVNDAEVLWLKHDEAVSSSLLEQGVPKEVVAVAFTNTDISDDGRSLLAAAGLHGTSLHQPDFTPGNNSNRNSNRNNSHTSDLNQQ